MAKLQEMSTFVGKIFPFRKDNLASSCCADVSTAFVYGGSDWNSGQSINWTLELQLCYPSVSPLSHGEGNWGDRVGRVSREREEGRYVQQEGGIVKHFLTRG